MNAIQKRIIRATFNRVAADELIQGRTPEMWSGGDQLTFESAMRQAAQESCDDTQEREVIMANVRRWQKAKERRMRRQFNSVGHTLEAALSKD